VDIEKAGARVAHLIAQAQGDGPAGSGEAPQPLKRKPLIRLVVADFKPGDNDTAQGLRQQLDDAERGELIGYATVLMYRDREWSYQLRGEAVHHPQWALGMLTSLVVELANDINRR
jgi:hypothetical protein